MFAPKTPKETRASTGKGIPNFVPAWALRIMGTRTIKLPRVMVKMACHQFIPPSMRAAANMYVGMLTDKPTQSAATSYVPQVRSAIFVGARSSLYRRGSRVPALS